MKIKEKVVRLKEDCPWCGKKTLGKDEFGYEACVSCEYDSREDKHKDMDLEESLSRGMNIYDNLVCNESNPNVGFTSICSKLKGHPGKHKDKGHPDFDWEDKPTDNEQ